MSDDSVDSSIDDEEEAEEGRNRRRARASGSRVARRLRALLCCLKREPNADETVKCDPDEYDYVVEKLVVRRVPLALFAIPADLADNASRSTSLSSAIDGGDCVIKKASTNRTAANKILRFGNERQASINESRDYRIKSSIWREEIPNRLTLSSDLKKSKCPFKDTLNFSRSKRLFAEDISEATSSTRTDASSRTTFSMTVQDDIPTRVDDSTHYELSNSLFGLGTEKNQSRAERDDATRDVFSEKKQDKFVPGRNQKYIVSPFRVRRGSFDLAKTKGIVEDGVDGKSLSYIEESPKNNKSSEPKKDAKDRNLGSKTSVRWRITVKRQRANATLEHPVSKV